MELLMGHLTPKVPRREGVHMGWGVFLTSLHLGWLSLLPENQQLVKSI